MPWLLLLKANAKVVAIVALLLSVGVASYQLKAKLCALEVAEIKQSIVSAQMAAEEKQKLAAEKLAVQTRTIHALRSEINRRALDAEDSSFGCHVNPDGMSILGDAKRLANAGR